MHGKAARVAGAISGESRMKKISGNVRRNSRCRLFASFPSCRKQQKLKYWASRFCDLAHRSGANYREAYRARSRAEFIAKCGDSLRELEETTYWLELLVDGKIVPADKLSIVRQEWSEWDERHTRQSR
jgi:four helix bundle protein